jgi:hypothetical protein
MFSKSLSVWLAGWMIVASVAPYAQAKKDPRGAHTSRVKAAIQRLGRGESARLKVELYDGTKLAGFIVEIGEDQFVLHDAKTGKNTEIAYSAVKRLQGKRQAWRGPSRWVQAPFSQKQLSLCSPLWLLR